MKEITPIEGRRCLPLVWNVFLTRDEDYFIDSFSYQDLRIRCIFEPNPSDDGMRVWLHVAKDEIFKDLKLAPGPIYLYGAYNRVNVCQICVRGEIREMDVREKAVFIKKIKKRLLGKNIGDILPSALETPNREWTLKKMGTGKFYLFVPSEYFYDLYQRG